jgi:hypothetical protein
MEKICFSDMSGSLWTSWHYNPEDHTLNNTLYCITTIMPQSRFENYSRSLRFWTFVFQCSKAKRLGNCICLCPQVKGKEAPTLLGPLETVNLQSSDCSPLCFFEHYMMDKLKSVINPECYTPLSEPFHNSFENCLPSSSEWKYNTTLSSKRAVYFTLEVQQEQNSRITVTYVQV